MGAVTIKPDEDEERNENDPSANSESAAEDPGGKSNGDVLPWLDATFLSLLRSDGTNLVGPVSSTESLRHRHRY
jgi:hypothetical protein